MCPEDIQDAEKTRTSNGICREIGVQNMSRRLKKHNHPTKIVENVCPEDFQKAEKARASNENYRKHVSRRCPKD